MTHQLHDGLPEQEKSDFSLACRTFGRQSADFRIVWEEIFPDHGEVDHIERLVTVHALGTESEPVTYDGGPGTNWVDGFAADLAAGTFDAVDAN